MTGDEEPIRPDLTRLPPPTWPEDATQAVEAAGGYLPNIRWTYGQAVTALLIGILLGPFVVGAAIAILGDEGAVDDASTFIFLGAQAASSLGILFYLSRARGTGSWIADYGFSLRPRYLWGIALGMALQIAVALASYPLIQWFAPDEGPQQEIARVAASLGGWEVLFFAIFVAGVAPVFEEVVFRGMLLGRLTKAMGRHRAVAISAAAFAATHLFDTNALLVVPGLFLIGLVLGYAALHAGDLSLPIFIHVGVNALAVVLLTYADELENLSENLESIRLSLF